MRMYSIFDIKAQWYMSPTTIRNDEEAKRMFGDLAADERLEIGKHPEDFLLVRVGTFNNETGQLEGTEPTIIAKGEKK